MWLLYPSASFTFKTYDECSRKQRTRQKQSDTKERKFAPSGVSSWCCAAENPLHRRGGAERRGGFRSCPTTTHHRACRPLPLPRGESAIFILGGAVLRHVRLSCVLFAARPKQHFTSHDNPVLSKLRNTTPASPMDAWAGNKTSMFLSRLCSSWASTLLGMTFPLTVVPRRLRSLM